MVGVGQHLASPRHWYRAISSIRPVWKCVIKELTNTQTQSSAPHLTVKRWMIERYLQLWCYSVKRSR